MKAVSRDEEAGRGVPLVLKLAACTLFFGRGAIYLSGLSPLSTFFWQEGWLAGIVEAWLGVPWEAYAASSEVLILDSQRILGVFFVLCGVVVWWVDPVRRRWASGTVLAGTVCLVPFWLLRWVDKDFQIGMFLEHFLQWGTPLLLVLWRRMALGWWYALGWVLVSATFVGHGLYAIGLGVPHSNDFVNMCIKILGTDEAGGRAFLRGFGYIDLFLPPLFLVPYLRGPALLYATFWGMVTAIARVVAYWTPAEDYYGMIPGFFDMVVRFPHGLVPLAMVLVLRRAYGSS